MTNLKELHVMVGILTMTELSVELSKQVGDLPKKEIGPSSTRQFRLHSSSPLELDHCLDVASEYVQIEMIHAICHS
jgi:hypothetical protein